MASLFHILASKQWKDNKTNSPLPLQEQKTFIALQGFLGRFIQQNQTNSFVDVKPKQSSYAQPNKIINPPKSSAPLSIIQNLIQNKSYSSTPSFKTLYNTQSIHQQQYLYHNHQRILNPPTIHHHSVYSSIIKPTQTIIQPSPANKPNQNTLSHVHYQLGQIQKQLSVHQDLLSQNKSVLKKIQAPKVKWSRSHFKESGNMN